MIYLDILNCSEANMWADVIKVDLIILRKDSPHTSSDPLLIMLPSYVIVMLGLVQKQERKKLRTTTCFGGIDALIWTKGYCSQFHLPFWSEIFGGREDTQLEIP